MGHKCAFWIFDPALVVWRSSYGRRMWKLTYVQVFSFTPRTQRALFGPRHRREEIAAFVLVSVQGTGAAQPVVIPPQEQVSVRR